MALHNNPSRFWGSLMIVLLIEAFGSTEVTDDVHDLDGCGAIGSGMIFTPQMWQKRCDTCLDTSIYCDTEQDGWSCFFLPLTSCPTEFVLPHWKEPNVDTERVGVVYRNSKRQIAAYEKDLKSRMRKQLTKVIAIHVVLNATHDNDLIPISNRRGAV